MPHHQLSRCNLQFLLFGLPLVWLDLSSSPSIALVFVCLAAHDLELCRQTGGVDRRIRQTFAASPAEPGELPLGFRNELRGGPNNPHPAGPISTARQCSSAKPR
jgi:hypothetical protein